MSEHARPVTGHLDRPTELRRAASAWMHRRTCPTCGYMGPELQADAEPATFECPLCAHDLYARPARSYAEREGLVELIDPAAGASSRVAQSRSLGESGWWRVSKTPEPRGVVARAVSVLRRVGRRVAEIARNLSARTRSV